MSQALKRYAAKEVVYLIHRDEDSKLNRIGMAGGSSSSERTVVTKPQTYSLGETRPRAVPVAVKHAAKHLSHASSDCGADRHSGKQLAQTGGAGQSGINQ